MPSAEYYTNVAWSGKVWLKYFSEVILNPRPTVTILPRCSQETLQLRIEIIQKFVNIYYIFVIYLVKQIWAIQGWNLVSRRSSPAFVSLPIFRQWCTWYRICHFKILLKHSKLYLLPYCTLVVAVHILQNCKQIIIVYQLEMSVLFIFQQCQLWVSFDCSNCFREWLIYWWDILFHSLTLVV